MKLINLLEISSFNRDPSIKATNFRSSYWRIDMQNSTNLMFV